MNIRPTDILLLQPPITLKRCDAQAFGHFPPLGLAYLAALLEEAGHNPLVIDLQVEGGMKHAEINSQTMRLGPHDEEIAVMLREATPKIVGISSMFTAFAQDAIDLARLVRRVLPGTLIVMGGAHVTADAESVVAQHDADVVVLGEGEYIFLRLVNLAVEGDFHTASSLPGTVWNTCNGVVNNGYPGPIADIDALPLPAYHLLPMERYIWQRQANFAVSRRWPVGHMIATRGCLYNCVFCSTTRLYKKFRPRAAVGVLAEMKLLIRRYGIREFHFHDDSFLSAPAFVRELCQGILDEKLDVLWQVSQGINSVRLDESLLELMVRSGMYRVGFPIESGDEATLRFVRKPVDLGKVKMLIQKCNELGVYTFGCFMVGFPEETPEQIERTITFMLDSGLDYAKISIVQPLAGSELYESFRDLGLIVEPKHGSTYWRTEYDTIYLSAQELNALRATAVRDFSMRRIHRILTPAGIKRYLFPKLKGREEVVYFFRMAWLALKGV